jgi:hypothetical protein
MKNKLRLTVYFFILLSIQGCIHHDQEKTATCLRVPMDTPPTKIRLRSFDQGGQEIVLINNQGSVFFAKTKMAELATPALQQQYGAQEYINALNLSWQVISNNYSYAAEGGNNASQKIYELSFGESWNAFSIRIPVKNGEPLPKELGLLADYLNCLESAPGGEAQSASCWSAIQQREKQ